MRQAPDRLIENERSEYFKSSKWTQLAVIGLKICRKDIQKCGRGEDAWEEGLMGVKCVSKHRTVHMSCTHWPLNFMENTKIVVQIYAKNIKLIAITAFFFSGYPDYSD